MIYNLTLVSNSTSLLGLTTNVNTYLMHGLLGTMYTLIIVSIMFIGFYAATGEVKKSALGATFISFILSLFLRALGLVPDLTVFVLLIGCAVSLALALKSS